MIVVNECGALYPVGDSLPHATWRNERRQPWNRFFYPIAGCQGEPLSEPCYCERLAQSFGYLPGSVIECAQCGGCGRLPLGKACRKQELSAARRLGQMGACACEETP